MAWRPRSCWPSAALAPPPRAARIISTAQARKTVMPVRMPFVDACVNQLDREHDAIVAGIGAAVEAAGMHPDGVHRGKAVGVGIPHDLVPPAYELALNPARYAVRDVDGIAGGGKARRG